MVIVSNEKYYVLHIVKYLNTQLLIYKKIEIFGFLNF